jgi:hypothetical protein
MAKRFQQPTPEQVTEYAASIGFILDGEAFCDFYAAKGWKIGQSPMKDWQAAVRTWKRRQQADGTLKPAVDLRASFLAEAVSRTVNIQQYVRYNRPFEGTDPREALSRYWKALRDKHGEAFIDDLKKRLKK